jgi:hypothetical protein
VAERAKFWVLLRLVNCILVELLKVFSPFIPEVMVLPNCRLSLFGVFIKLEAPDINDMSEH